MLRGEVGPANAWIARGQRLVEDRDCAERGYVLIAVAEQQLRDGQADAAHATASQAAGVGECFDDADLTAAARHVQGRALIDQGDVVAGLKRLDETMLAVVADELSPIMTGLMYCSVIDTCRQVYALGRAREWTSAFSRVCEQQPEMSAFTGTCLVHRSEILQLQGAWPDALTEACRACERAAARGAKAARRGALSTGRDPPSPRRVCEGGGRLSRRERTGLRTATRARAPATGARTHRRRVRGDPPADERDQRSAATRQTLAGLPRDHAGDRRCRGRPARPR